MKRWMLTFVVVSLFGCGGGGGGGGGGTGGGGISVSVSNGSSTSTSKSYKLSLQGTIVAGSVGAISFDLAVPASITARPDITASGVAPSGAIVMAGYSQGTLHVGGISTPTGFSSGEFATIVCTIPAGVTAPSPAEFSITNLVVTDEAGNSM